jgi:excinuclease ABC subunit A
MDDQDSWIRIRGAREHNLRALDLDLPRGGLIVVTGVSGSGKSSLAFDTLFREGQRRFLETLPAFSRQFAKGLARPGVASLQGLGPAVAVGQRSGLSNPRSTVGTLTEVWDLLRLLFARLGRGPEGVALTRGLFSFNGADGACPRCAGLGVEDRLDLDLLVADPARSLRQGALHVSTPNGYLMYSQVTLAVLDEVLHAHGGSVDIPWADLGEEVRNVVLYGSSRLKVAYGKHPLESRLKWTGITARPRQEGYYRGLVPVMEEILRGKRNDSILRYVRSTPCEGCGGLRLRPEALAVRWRGRGITDLARMTAAGLGGFLRDLAAAPAEAAVLEPIREDVLARASLMEELGLGYLTFDRPAPSLSLGEAQRLRLLDLVLGELRGLLLVLDEPSAGLHPADAHRLLQVLRRLRDRGQTVVVVEHDPVIALGADWLVDLGPGPGASGGQVLYSGPPAGLLAADGPDTPTRRWLTEPVPAERVPRKGPRIHLEKLTRNNLQDLSVDLVGGALNVVTGVSGAGKTSLLTEAAARLAHLRTVTVDAAPIGRTPRSNAATYSGAFDLIRNLFAATGEARALGLGKGHFTFNTPGGRCEACEGAGVLEVGMKHLGTVSTPCEACGGRRFHPEVLAVTYRGRSIADVLDADIREASALFADQPRLARILSALLDCGLGHLTLGQPATSLSGGEAQRVKLATELARAAKGPSLIALDEPTTGLHAADTRVLLGAWERLLEAGHTLLVVDNDPAVIRAADQVLDLGPGSGAEGGRLVVSGPPPAVAACGASLTGRSLRGLPAEGPVPPPAGEEPPMELLGVTTHNLQGLDAAFPPRGLTVVTGPSGSGKSSLVFDTLLAESRNRFNDLVSPWARRFLPRQGGAEFVEARGLRAAVAVSQGSPRRNPRSRVGTVTEVDELFRLLYSRAGGAGLPASAFSPNGEEGACPRCKGLGFIQACDPDRLVTRPDLPLGAGALDGTRFGAYLGEPDGRYVATLETVGRALGLDFTRAWRDLGSRERQVAMHGCGDEVFQVAWRYRRGSREGTHALATAWEGFAALVDAEYDRLHADAKGEALETLLGETPCPDCRGERLNARARAVAFRGLRLPELSRLTAAEARAWLEGLPLAGPAAVLRDDILPRLRALEAAGLGYLAAEREMASLSGGEAQRVRLASALGSGLSGVAYVLDEPTQGLHPGDTARLVGVLRALAAAGNAVVVVEHDPVLVAAADHILELGPGAGPEGGRLMASGPPASFGPDTCTGRLLRGPDPHRGRATRPLEPGVTVRGAFLHNLRGLDAAFPRGGLVAVTGPSGSGKSTLVHGVLEASLRARFAGRSPVGCAALDLHAPFAGVESLARSSAAGGTVATAAGFAEALRKRFAATPRARALKLAARNFSTASPGGRCEACEGKGVLTVAMDLLPDVTLGCEACGGLGFRGPVLECLLAGRTIAATLGATVAELLESFRDDALLAPPLQALVEAGLGYLRPGQETRTLSSGEGQRLRLSLLLRDPGPAPVAILLDEPARGLGAADVERLGAALRRLAAAGHLVVAVEHDPVLIREADWNLELGPGGGPEGGNLMSEGAGG